MRVLLTFFSSLEHLSCDNHLNLRNLDNMANEIQGWSKLTLGYNFVDITYANTDSFEVCKFC